MLNENLPGRCTGRTFGEALSRSRPCSCPWQPRRRRRKKRPQIQRNEAAQQQQLTNGERLINPIKSGVTMATQTLDTSMTSLRSGELSVEEVDDEDDDDEEEETAEDNDVISTRPFSPDIRGTMQSPVAGMVNPAFDYTETGITYSTKYPAREDVPAVWYR